MTEGDLDRMADDVRRTRTNLGETMDELRRRLDPQTLKRQANDMMRSTDDATGLVETLKSNPIPLAMIGIGIGWLLIGGGNNGGHRGGHGYGDQIRDWADRNTRGTRSRVQRAMHRAGEAVHDVGDRASETLHNMRERVTGEHGGPSEHGPGAQTRAADLHGTAGMGVGHRPDGTHRPDGGSTMAMARSSAAGLWQVVDDYPLAAGLMGLALGAALGAAIPSTDTENAWMGEWGDEIRSRGSDYGSDLIERGSAVATAAFQGGVEAGKAEIAHEHGHGPADEPGREGGPDEGR
jgi:hypothetical protein